MESLDVSNDAGWCNGRLRIRTPFSMVHECKWMAEHLILLSFEIHSRWATMLQQEPQATELEMISN